MTKKKKIFLIKKKAKIKTMSKKDFHEMPDEEFVKLVKEFISDVGIEKMFKYANLTRDEEEDDIVNKTERKE